MEMGIAKEHEIATTILELCILEISFLRDFLDCHDNAPITSNDASPVRLVGWLISQYMFFQLSWQLLIVIQFDESRETF